MSSVGMALVINDTEETTQVFDLKSIQPLGSDNFYIIQVPTNQKPISKIPYGAGPELTREQLLKIKENIISLLRHKK